MKVLVSGGAGYIGSHTVVELLEAGFEVDIIDNYSNSNPDVVDAIESICNKKPGITKLDLTDLSSLQEYFSRNNDYQGVIHFAALKAVGESVEQPLKYYQNNLISLMNLLQCMSEFGINNLVFSSSCTVYGEPDVLPVKENSPVQKAISPYGNTKQIAEDIIHDSSVSSSLKAISLRYFNPIGAHETALIGELPLGIPNNLMPFVTQTAIGIREELKVFGDDYDTPDGTPIRDYIHVTDLALAHIAALNRMIKENQKADYEVFNIGTGKGYSVMEVISSFEKVSGRKLNYSIAGRREGDITKVWADTELANDELGWKAKRGIDEMVSSAWKWELYLNEKKNTK